jgi:hypothetical protein
VILTTIYLAGVKITDMIQPHRPTLVCLQEMKLEISWQIAMGILGQSVDGFHFLPARGTGGHPPRLES